MIIPNGFDLNHQNSLNLTDVTADGTMWAMLHKVSQGTGFRDPAYTKRVAAARELGLLVAGYDFATSDNVAQNVANYLLWANLQNQDAACLDFEDNSHSEMSGDQAYEWIDRVQQKIGRAAIIYGGNRIAEHINSQDKKWIDMAQVVRLWRCRYINMSIDNNKELFDIIKPYAPWKSCFGIQYTGDGAGPKPHTHTGLENGADLNVFCPDLTKDKLKAIWAGNNVTIHP